MKEFSLRDVRGAFRKFNDLAGELARAGISSWRGLLKRLLHHCVTDPVMRVITEPLRARKGIGVNAWYEFSMRARSYELPCDDDERLALLYQLFEAIDDREHTRLDETIFAHEVLGGTTPDDEYRVLSEHFVVPFARDVGYRLQDILDDVADRDSVPLNLLRVFGETRSQVFIHGDVIASAVGTGASLTADNIVAFKEAVSRLDPDLREALIRARDNAETTELAAHDREDVINELHRLVDALNASKRERVRVRRYWQRIKDIAPTIADILSSVTAVSQFLR